MICSENISGDTRRELIPINDRKRPRVFQLDCVEEVDFRQNSLIVRERHMGMKGWKSFLRCLQEDGVYKDRIQKFLSPTMVGWSIPFLKVVGRKSEWLSVNSG